MRHGHVLIALLLAVVACTETPTAPTSTIAAEQTTTTTTSTTSTTSESPQLETPDLILHNGHVVTVDGDFRIASAVAVTEGVITSVGTDGDLLPLAGTGTKVIDLDGRSVIPGVVETHTHTMQVIAPNTGAMLAGQEALLAQGITTAGMPSVLPEQLPAFEEIADQMVLRAHLYITYNSVCGEPIDDFYLSQPFVSDPQVRLAVRGVKVFSDGGVCQAPAMSFQYPDAVPQDLQDRGWSGNGVLYVTSDEVTSVVEAVDAAGGATVIHAIGDAAIATVLTGIDQAAELTQPHQVHHNSLSSLVDPVLLAVYGERNLMPVVQLMPWAGACEPGLSELWRSILPDPAYELTEDFSAIRDANPGIRFAWHGDAPSIPGSPLEQAFSGITRGAAYDGSICYPEAWAGRAVMDIAETLQMITINAAEAMGLADYVGSIEPGKYADLAILESDPLGPDPEIALATNRVLATIAHGEVVFCLDICTLFSGNIETDPLENVATDAACSETNPVSWWMGEGNPVDSVSGIPATAVDSVGYGPGVVGDGFVLSGGGVRLPDQPDLGAGFTLEGWVLFDGTNFEDFQNIFNNNQLFLRKNNSSEGNGLAGFVSLDDGTVEERAQMPRSVTPGVWHHFAISWDGANLSLYVNGELSGSAERNGSLTNETVAAHFGQGEALESEGVHLRGALDEVAFFNRVLGAEEVRAIFDSGSAGKCAS